MLTTKPGNHLTMERLYLLEFNRRYSNPEILRRLNNCKVLIGHQARQSYGQWMDARRHKATETSLEAWMVGVQVAVVGENDMLQVEHTDQLIDVMPSDLAELVSFDGPGYTFKVARDGDVIKICSLTDTWAHR